MRVNVLFPHWVRLESTCELTVGFTHFRCASPAGPVHRLATMNVSKQLAGAFLAPARMGLAAAEASLAVAGAGVGLARRALGDTEGPPPSSAMANLLGIDSTMAKVNRLTAMLDDSTPLGQALAPGGPVERLMQPGGPLERAVAPGGLVDQLLAEEGLVERLLSEDGLAERLLAKGGLVDVLTARNGPLEQIAFTAETLNKVTPNLEALTPTIDLLRDAVESLSTMANPLGGFAERLTGRSRSRRNQPTPRIVSAERVVDADDDDR
jgi:hypothetical protein